MSLLSKFKYDDTIQTEQDVLGSAYKALETDIYLATVKHAYIQEAKSGAVGVHLEFEINGNPYKETLYISNKEGKNYYVKDGKKNYLPSFITMDALALFTCKQPLANLDTQQKVIKLYNWEQQKEVPTEVPMITEMLGKQVKLGILKQVVNVQAKVDGQYVPTEETKEENTINKVFHPETNKTTAEVRAKVEEAEFYNKWLNQWKGKTKDNTKKITATKQPTQSKAVASLFN